MALVDASKPHGLALGVPVNHINGLLTNSLAFINPVFKDDPTLDCFPEASREFCPNQLPLYAYLPHTPSSGVVYPSITLNYCRHKNFSPIVTLYIEYFPPVNISKWYIVLVTWDVSICPCHIHITFKAVDTTQ